MVFYYTSSEGYMVYMGKDKFENEDLIKYGLPEDVWFHVDNYSSAHVYLRMNQGQTLDDISPETILEMCTFVKANSIEGSKQRIVDVVYTRWKNLHKTPAMEVGSVSFKDNSRVRKLQHVQKNNAIVNDLNRTKEERHPDLEAEQAERAAEWRREQKRKKQEQARKEKEERAKREEEKRLRSYEGIMGEENKTYTDDVQATEDQSAAVAWEDDFM